MSENSLACDTVQNTPIAIGDDLWYASLHDAPQPIIVERIVAPVGVAAVGSPGSWGMPLVISGAFAFSPLQLHDTEEAARSYYQRILSCDERQLAEKLAETRELRARFGPLQEDLAS